MGGDTALEYSAPTPENGGFLRLANGALRESYTKIFSLVYPATRDITSEIETQIPIFVQRAKQRVADLIFIIQTLRWQMEDARKVLIATNYRLHRMLRYSGNEDPTKWDEGEENETPAKKPDAAKKIEVGTLDKLFEGFALESGDAAENS